jgi:NAD(P)-dependent dehydrogenase (short-subunit alcohol dehydrogenase family)
MSGNTIKSFDITGRVAVITGGAGLLGTKHAEAIIESGGVPVLVDINGKLAEEKAKEISEKYNKEAFGCLTDITDKRSLETLKDKINRKYGRVDILINNAANDPKVKEKLGEKPWTRFENFPEDVWNNDLAVGLKGTFLCSQVFGTVMAARDKGVILNVASDLGIIAPDQRIYRKDGLPENMQPVKPVTYSVVKHALIGLTKYLATYWSNKGVRVNSICPGGVYNNQPDDFVKKLTNLIPLGRMADIDEYKAAVLFMVSDASSYMTGATLIIDGGRTCW